MELGSALVVFKESAVFFFSLLPYLLAGLFVGAGLEVTLSRRKEVRWLKQPGTRAYMMVSLLGVGTPLWSCNTVGVIIPFLTAGVPWALIMSFLISSPLNSPNTFFLIAGALGYPMAIAQIVAAMGMGVGSGRITSFLESKGYLKNQVRAPKTQNDPLQVVNQESFSGKSGSVQGDPKNLWNVFWTSLFRKGTRRLVQQLAMFVIVASVIKILVPTAWISALFGKNQWYSIPFAALLGIPLYVNNASSIPVTRTLVEGGMSAGAALAFLLAGAGTSLPAMSGLLLITRGRIVALYVLLIFFGAVIFGSAYSLVVG
jgi:uncharacterized protein